MQFASIAYAIWYDLGVELQTHDNQIYSITAIRFYISFYSIIPNVVFLWLKKSKMLPLIQHQVCIITMKVS